MAVDGVGATQGERRGAAWWARRCGRALTWVQAGAALADGAGPTSPPRSFFSSPDLARFGLLLGDRRRS